MIKSPKEREATHREIGEYSKRLMLSSRVVDLCEQEAPPKHEEFLHRVLNDEIERREQNRKGRLLTKAGFPTLKSFSEYEFTAIRFPQALSKKELLSINFVGQKKNLFLYGAIGTSKTRMAIALGVLACEAGYKVRFYTVTELVLRLSEAYKSGTLERLVRDVKGLAAALQHHRRQL